MSYCTGCGHQGEGNFCPLCGASMTSNAKARDTPSEPSSPSGAPSRRRWLTLGASLGVLLAIALIALASGVAGSSNPSPVTTGASERSSPTPGAQALACAEAVMGVRRQLDLTQDAIALDAKAVAAGAARDDMEIGVVAERLKSVASDLSASGNPAEAMTTHCLPRMTVSAEISQCSEAFKSVVDAKVATVTAGRLTVPLVTAAYQRRAGDVERLTSAYLAELARAPLSAARAAFELCAAASTSN